ncbi:AraC family transcriptional regulator ligand-binding domain-containing protein [Blastococcus sp. TML/M2B]|nr:AraC family transcriptional regulator ligand-binding domain-containing protein [Blastococcus sp. TML/M2B]MBN1092795.1 AraC family transcriptional regulator ligand-binding domain-containing protein [Blastococcus sp. TML/M2B]
MSHATIGRELSIPANPQHPFDAPVRGTGSVALLCGLAVEHGLPRRDVLAGGGIPEEALEDPAAEITGEQEMRAIAAIAGSLPEDAGLTAGARYRLASYGIWGFALLSSRTLREGTEVAMRFVDLTYALTRVSAREDDGEVRLFFDDLDVPEHVRRFVLLRDSSAALQLWRETLGRPVVPLRVALRPAAARRSDAVRDRVRSAAAVRRRTVGPGLRRCPPRPAVAAGSPPDRRTLRGPVPGPPPAPPLTARDERAGA